MKFDVVMPTFNSERLLRKVLDTVYKEIPVCHLIVVDGYSTDKTLEIVKKYQNVKIIRSRVSLGKRRELGIKEVDTEWFVFVDSDVVLEDDWLNKVKEYVKPDVGAVEGLDLLMDPRRGAFQAGMVSLRKLLGKKQVSKRGFTGDTLIKTKLLSDFAFRHKWTHGTAWGGAFADWLIRWHIKDKGYRWVKTKDYVCRHYDFKPPERCLVAGEFLTFIGLISVKDRIKNLVTMVPKLLYAFYVTREWRMIPYQVKWNFYYLKGALRGRVKRRLAKGTKI